MEQQKSHEETQKLPCSHQLGEKVCVRFMGKDAGILIGTVNGVHFYGGKVRYDIWIETYKLPNEETQQDEQFFTRLYNIEAVFVAKE